MLCLAFVNITQEHEPASVCPNCKSDLITVAPMGDTFRHLQCNACRHQWNEYSTQPFESSPELVRTRRR